MKINVSKHHLFTKLRTVGKIVKSGKEVAYSSFLFTVKGGKLAVTGCDESGQIATVVDCEIIDPEEIGFLIDAQMILNSLKELPDQPIKITLEKQDLNVAVVIHYYNGKFEMIGSDPALFPSMPDRSKGVKFIVDSKVLKKGLALSKFAATDELRPIMTTVNLSRSENVTSFAGTSGHVLGMYEDNVGNAVSTVDVNVNVPGKISKIVMDLLADETDIPVEYDSQSILFLVGEYTIRYRLFEGRFPNYRSVIPKDFTMQVKVNTAELTAAINRVSIFADEDSSMVKIELKDNNLSITSKSIDYGRSAKEDLFLDQIYDNFEIGFKSSLLIEILKSINTEECLINLTAPDKAAVLVPAEKTGHTFLIMPMQVNN